MKQGFGKQTFAQYVTVHERELIMYWPDSRSDRVVLNSPWAAAVNALSVHLEPLAHLSQTLLKDGHDAAVVCGTHVQQQIPPAGHGLNQRLEDKHRTSQSSACA